MRDYILGTPARPAAPSRVKTPSAASATGGEWGRTDVAPSARGETAYFAGAGAAGMAGMACNSFITMAGSMAGAMFCMFIIWPQVP